MVSKSNCAQDHKDDELDQILKEQEAFFRGNASKPLKKSLFAQQRQLKSPQNDSQHRLARNTVYDVVERTDKIKKDIIDLGAVKDKSRGFPQAERISRNTDTVPKAATEQNSMHMSSLADYAAENEYRIANMSMDEIEEAQSEIQQLLSPQVVASIMQKKGVLSLNAQSKELLNSTTKPAATHLNSEEAKLQWTMPIAASDEVQLGGGDDDLSQLAKTRFDLNGKELSLEESASLPVSKGLHHHGDNADLAGYTVGELLYLTRSTVASQRATGLGVLERLVTRYIDTPFYKLFCRLRGLLFTIDRLSDSSVSVKLAALKLLAAALDTSRGTVHQFVKSLMPVSVTDSGFQANIPMATFFTKRMERENAYPDVRFHFDQGKTSVPSQFEDADMFYVLLISCNLTEKLCKLLAELIVSWDNVEHIELVLHLLYRCALYDPCIAFSDPCRSDLFRIIQRSLLPRIEWPNEDYLHVVWAALNLIESLVRLSGNAVAEQVLNSDLLGDLMRFVSVDSSSSSAHWFFICQIWRAIVMKSIGGWEETWTNFYSLFQDRMYSLQMGSCFTLEDTAFCKFMHLVSGYSSSGLFREWSESQVDAFSESVNAFASDVCSRHAQLHFIYLVPTRCDVARANGEWALAQVTEKMALLNRAKLRKENLRNCVNPFENLKVLAVLAELFALFEYSFENALVDPKEVSAIPYLETSWMRWYYCFPLGKAIFSSSAYSPCEKLVAIGNFGVIGHEPYVSQVMQQFTEAASFVKYFNEEERSRFLVTDGGSFCSSEGEMIASVGLPTLLPGGSWIMQFAKLSDSHISTLEKLRLFAWANSLIPDIAQVDSDKNLACFFFEVGRILYLVHDSDSDMVAKLVNTLSSLLRSAMATITEVNVRDCYTIFFGLTERLGSVFDINEELAIQLYCIPFLLYPSCAELDDFKLQFWSVTDNFIPRVPLWGQVAAFPFIQDRREQNPDRRAAMQRLVYNSKKFQAVYSNFVSRKSAISMKDFDQFNDDPFLFVYALYELIM